MRRSGWLVGLAFVLAACQGQPGGNWIGVNVPGDTGTLPAGWKEQVEGRVKSRLRDPYSAVISVGAPVATYCMIGIYGPFYGHAVPVSYNAKNLYGAYVGEEYRVFWFANGAIRRESQSMTYCP